MSAYEEYCTLTMYEDKDSTPLKMLFKHLNLIDLEYVLQFPLLTLPWKSQNSINFNMWIRLRHLVTFRAQVRTNVSRDMCLQILCIIDLLCLSQPKSQLIQCMHMCLCCLCMNDLLSVLSPPLNGPQFIIINSIICYFLSLKTSS